MSTLQLGSECIHAGYHAANAEARQLPIVQSTTFLYERCEEMAKCFDLESNLYFYTRLANPTSDAVAAKIAVLEGGKGAILTSSGQAATFYAVFNICQAGDHVVASSAIYGGSFNLFNVTMRRMGVKFSFVPPHATPEELEAAIQDNTKAVFVETLSNPSLDICDLERFAAVAHAHGLPLIVDNTFATPILCRPLDWGADIVVHSTTKYMDGHAAAVGGAIVDGGRFDWRAHAAAFPELTKADASYHGMIYAERFPETAYLMKILAQLMRDLGATPSPQNAFLLNLGLETLHLRMPRHSENALRLAAYLNRHPKIDWVRYPGLEGDSQHALAQKYLPHGASGVLAIGVHGGREAAMRLMAGLSVFSIATHVADIRSCVLHPASTTHRQLSDAELHACGVRPEMVRVSCGCETADDLLGDFEQALAQV